MTTPKSPYRTRIVLALASAAAVPALLGASPGPAHAVDSELLLGSDGVNYAQSPTRPVSGPLTGFVPGSSTTADIWIRDETIDGAVLSVTPGESDRLTFTLDLDPDASNATRRQQTGFALRFLLEDQDGAWRRRACAAGGGTVTPGLTVADPLPPQAPRAPFAVTGAPDLSGWFLAAVAFLTAGIGILAYMQRKREGSDGPE